MKFNKCKKTFYRTAKCQVDAVKFQTFNPFFMSVKMTKKDSKDYKNFSKQKDCFEQVYRS